MATMEMFKHLLSECLGDYRPVMKEDYLTKCGKGVSVCEEWFDPLIPGRTVLRHTLGHQLVE